jgi:hypothetical protein
MLGFGASSMSMHKVPLTKVEEDGLRAHGLDIGTPSQLSDAFRLGVAWGQKAEREKRHNDKPAQDFSWSDDEHEKEVLRSRALNSKGCQGF